MKGYQRGLAATRRRTRSERPGRWRGFLAGVGLALFGVWFHRRYAKNGSRRALPVKVGK